MAQKEATGFAKGHRGNRSGKSLNMEPVLSQHRGTVHALDSSFSFTYVPTPDYLVTSALIPAYCINVFLSQCIFHGPHSWTFRLWCSFFFVFLKACSHPGFTFNVRQRVLPMSLSEHILLLPYVHFSSGTNTNNWLFRLLGFSSKQRAWWVLHYNIKSQPK